MPAIPQASAPVKPGATPGVRGLACAALLAFFFHAGAGELAAQVTPSTAPVVTNGLIAAQGEPQLLSLYSYKPIYFLAGNPYSKIQISFETQIVRGVPIYFGYTQLMLWDVFNQSPFFYDLNYNPLVWYRLTLNARRQEWIDFIPYEHESNGKGGSEERSWNRTGIAFNRSDNLGDTMTLYENFKIWAPDDVDANNKNLPEYRGIWELNLTLSHFLGNRFFDFNDLTLRLYPGGPSYTDPTRGGQELTLRLRGGQRRFLPFTVVQLFHGYGEYLQDYEKNQWQLRVGLGF